MNKILYVAFKYEYGKKENGLALNYKAFFENFIELGYDVDSLFYEDYSKEDLQLQILNKSENGAYDLIFFILQKDQVDLHTIKKLKESGVFTANFFGDDQWRFEGFSSYFAPHFSACITTDKFSIEKYFTVGQSNIIRSQWASLGSDVEFENINYKYDISFIGGCNRYRKWFVDTLSERGINVDCFGRGWDNGRVSYSEMEDIFAKSKINLNISNSTCYDIRYLLSSTKTFLSGIRAILNSGKDSSQTKARNFEIPVQGGFQLTDFVPSLDDYFEIGKEVVCYNSVDEVEKLINYYLSHDAERESIKLLGIKKAREQHTFKHRIKDFMVKLEEIKINER
ncbi:glycosyltransferase [Aliivibrio fischeri]|nr:glycosyltransferase [Aliivibrio fischeri]